MNIELLSKGYKDFEVNHQIKDLFIFKRKFSGEKIELRYFESLKLWVINKFCFFHSDHTTKQEAIKEVLKIMRLDILNNKGVFLR